MGIEAIYLLSFVAGVVYALVGGVMAGVLGGHGHKARASVSPMQAREPGQ